MKDITKAATRLELQGDKVLVVDGKEEATFTIIHFVDGDHHELLLADREHKNGESFPLTQQIADMLVPNKTPDAKWRLNLTGS